MIAKKYKDFAQLAVDVHAQYRDAEPFPHIVLDGVFEELVLEKILAEFPDLSLSENTFRFRGPGERKLAGKGEDQFGPETCSLMHFLNSAPFLTFLQELTGIKETLLPDPYFYGGGLHEIKQDGFLKLHVDFNKHPTLDLDRRINVLVYLNKDWQEHYGGHLELWDRSLHRCVQKISPAFNRMVIFSTTDYSWHGHPDPLACPSELSRKSLALYYFSLGRPAEEVGENHRTLFRGRQGRESRIWFWRQNAVSLLIDCMPPIILRAMRSIRDR